MSLFDPKRRFMSFVYAAKGFQWAFGTQGNMWVHMVATVLVIVAGLFFNITSMEWCILILTISMVFAAEFFNTAIEWTVDSIYKERHPLAGKIKDVSAAAVLMTAIASMIIGVVIFYPYIFKMFK